MNFFENLGEAIEKTLEANIEKSKNNTTIKASNLSENEIELAQKLDAIEEFTLDRFEDNIAVLENRKTGEITNINREDLPQEVKTGDILKKINGKYFINEEKTQEISQRIENKMNDLWK